MIMLPGARTSKDHPIAKRLTICPDRRGICQRHRRKLTPNQVAELRQPKVHLTNLAHEFGITTAAAYFIRWGYTYKDLPGMDAYK